MTSPVPTASSRNPSQLIAAASLASSSPASVRHQPDFRERIELLKHTLPEFIDPYTDKYFLRTVEILKAEHLNPWVTAQVFVRKGPGEIAGIEKAVAILEKYTDARQPGASLKILPEGSHYASGETVMLITAPVQSIAQYETEYLGKIARDTTVVNDQYQVSTALVRKNMQRVVAAAEGRRVIYMGARHWDMDEDAAISLAAFEGGAAECSTDIGAATVGKVGVGTIPHILENAVAIRYGKERAVVEATLAFDRHIDPQVPRVALIDYNNREVDDAVATAQALQGRLAAVRIDTCGENVMQGALQDPADAAAPIWDGVQLPAKDHPDARYWYGTGVSISGVYAIRKALDAAGHADVQIVLSSGFGDVRKVEAFVRAEKLLGLRLFDTLGVGSVIGPVRFATMDVVMAGSSPADLNPLAKAGRGYRENPNLQEIWAG
ncbi:MAG: nicotinate phosphoribosyltransferase [Oligoflexia bacterium]|nr:nicotinate phosphoribosyltransferase [Oligoflexia bacterium]